MLTKKLKTVVFMAGDKYGCGYYRMLLPSISLCRMGIPGHVMTVDRLHLYDIADTIVIQRPVDQSVIELVDQAHTNGMKVVYELDDNLWDLPTWNQAHPFWSPVRIAITSEILKRCDRAVTTTEYLANIMRQFNKDVMVVPNAIFDQKYIDLPTQLSYKTKTVIGWVGSSFHKKDTEIFKTLIRLLLEKYPDIGFLMMGEPPPKELSPFANRVIALPFVEPIYYHQILSSFNMHIGLAPLVDHNFNRAKSPIKLVEYLYTNTFPICSDIEPYANFKKEKETSCLLVPTASEQAGTISEWMDTIGWCIENVETVGKWAEDGKQYVLDNYNILCPKMAELYKKAYFVLD